jgi:2-oxoglutarate ferredoxin oxidoreductase subunit alpha
MDINILIGAEAGKGTARTSLMIGKAFALAGYYVFNYRDYPSLIKGGHNFNVLHISDKQIYSHENEYDIIIAFDQKTIEKHIKNLKKDGFILTERSLIKSEIENKTISIDASEIMKKHSFEEIMINNILSGSLFRILGIPLEFALKAAEKEFGEKSDKIKIAITEGYNLIKESKIKEIKKINKTKKNKKYFISGNEAIGLGALAAGLDVYISYPMTPASPLMHFLALQQKKHNIFVIQLEDEIACINAAIGASYAGARAMVGTSGGGFALMTEAISLQGMNEIPLVVYLAQRPGPSTGIPTYTSQGDLKFALNAGHGEFLRIVLAPGDAKEAFEKTIEAFYLSEKYRAISIILGDKHLGESTYSFDSFNLDSTKILEKIEPKDKKIDYKSYLITKDGISPREIPGSNFIVRATSYEHDEYGITTEDPEVIKRMVEKRLRKIETIKKEMKKIETFKIYGKGKNLIVGWGSTKGAIIDALKKLEDFRFLQIYYLSPFPKEIKKYLEDAKNVFIIENNATSLLSNVIAENIGIKIENKILKYDGRPFTPKEIIREIKKAVKK